MVAEELGDVLNVWSLTASCTSTAELEERLCELCVLHIALRVEYFLVANLGIQEVEVILLCSVVNVRSHSEGFVLSQTFIHTVTATGTVGY